MLYILHTGKSCSDFTLNGGKIAMRIVKIGAILLCIAALLTCVCAQAMTRDQLRDLYNAIPFSDQTPYLQVPDTVSFDPIGSLTPEAENAAIAYLNFIRAVAGLDGVTIFDLYTLRAQNAALLLAANDSITHDPARAPGMSEGLYESAHLGAKECNLVRFNWDRAQILIDAISYFVRDDGDANLAELSHRRWLLNPCMAETGFGLAKSASGMSYAAMYAVDTGNADAAWRDIAWPCGGAFPVELMRRDLAWSVSLNESIYDLSASDIRVTLTDLSTGDAFCFEPQRGTGDGFSTLSPAICGSGACIIFRPDHASDFEYQQNQRFHVSITGLKQTGGADATIEYTCEMASLFAQDVVNIEISDLDAQLRAGDGLALSAAVIPAYADDLAVQWSSTNPEIATVDANGYVTAHRAGECDIIASAANGKSDACHLTVHA